MSKDTIIDPEWEKENELRGAWGTRSRPRRGEPEDLDPFGVDKRDPEPEFVIEPKAGDGDLPSAGAGHGACDRDEEPDEPPFDPDEPAGEPGRAPRAVEPRPADRRPGDGEAPQPETAPEPDPFARPEEDRAVSKMKEYLGMMLSGSILTRTEVRRAYPYLIFIAFLMLLYISSVFRMQQLHRREQELSRQVKELRATSLELASRRMNLTRQSRVIEELQRREIPLEESLTPPRIVEK